MQEKKYKHRLKLAKNKELRFISHLDWQNLILKIFRRCELKLKLSEGFNKMPKVSYSPALPLFVESDCELVNFETIEPLRETFLEDFKKNSPQGLELISICDISPNEPKSLENYIQWALYSASVENKKNIVYNSVQLRYIIEKCLSSDEFLIEKKTKKGINKTVNYRNSIKSLTLIDDKTLSFILKTGQNDTIPALRADEFLKHLFELDNNIIFRIKRTKFFDSNLEVI